jgi:hypothetical protein
MSSLQDCCRLPCPTVPPVNIPGTPGADAFTFTSAAFTVPTVGSDVLVQVISTAGLLVGEPLLVSGPAHFTVATINGPETVTLAFQGLNGDVATGTVIAGGASVVPVGTAGMPGCPGFNGYATSTSSFVIPSVGQTVTVPVDNSACFVVNEDVISDGPSNFLVTAIPSATSVTLQFLGNGGNSAPGTTVNSSSVIAPAGSAGINAFTTLTAQLTIPNVNATVTAQVGNSKWMAIGQLVVISGPATFRVQSLPSTTSVVLVFLGYSGDLAPGNVLVSTSTVSPAGSQPVTGGSVSAVALGTAYTLTTTPQLLTFGTTSPSITLPTKGTWFLFATALSPITDVTATYAINLFLQRINNTAAQVPNSALNVTRITSSSGVQGSDSQIVLPLGFYSTTTAGDTIQLWGGITITSGSPTITVTGASLFAFQIA